MDVFYIKVFVVSLESRLQKSNAGGTADFEIAEDRFKVLVCLLLCSNATYVICLEMSGQCLAVGYTATDKL